MKKTLALCLFLLISVFLSLVPAEAEKIGVSITKGLNDGYEVSLPIDFDMQARLPFLPKAFLESAMIFTAPRGDFFSSMRSLNHSRFYLRLGGEITLFKGKFQWSSGAVNWFAGNNEGIPEGLVIDNKLYYYWDF